MEVRQATLTDAADSPLVVDVRFPMVQSESPRALEVARVFGLDVDEQREHVVYDHLGIDVRPGDVVLLTGPSGSGKSTLLRVLSERLGAETLAAVADDEVLIEGLDLPIEQAMAILAGVGLGEAMLMQRAYGQLSDGQKYRYRLAKLLGSPAKVIAIDEFGSLLDTTTAQVMSYSFQREVRRREKTLICATCREDLDEYLLPSLRVRKWFGSEVAFARNRIDAATRFPLLDEITYRSVGREEYTVCPLLRFHYRPHSVNSAICILFGYLRGEVVSVLVAAYPSVRSTGRNRFTDKAYHVQKGTGSETMGRLNREVATIKRVVVDPRFRGVGVGVHIVREYLERWTTRKLVETEAVMARYNPFFEKAGMTPIMVNRTDSVDEQLSTLGFDLRRMRSRAYVSSVLQVVDNEVVRKVAKKRLSEVSASGSHRGEVAEQLLQDDLVTFLMMIQKDDTMWLGWRNPHGFDNPPKTERVPRELQTECPQQMKLL